MVIMPAAPNGCQIPFALDSCAMSNIGSISVYGKFMQVFRSDFVNARLRQSAWMWKTDVSEQKDPNESQLSV